MTLPFHPVKPIRGGRPLDGLFRKLESDPLWVCQAKLNGKRAIWDGALLWSRQGNPIRGDVLQALQAAQAPCLDGEYMNGEFYAFDLPDHLGTLDERWLSLEQVIRDIGSPLIHLMPTNVSWPDVEVNSWEGVVFKKRGSKYKKAVAEGKEVSDWVKYRAEWL